MAGFSIWEHYTTIWTSQNMPLQSSKYISSSKYVRILNMAVLSIFLIQHNAQGNFERSVYKIGCLEKITTATAFNYFHKKHSISNLWEGTAYVRGFKCIRVLNIPWLSICHINILKFQGYTGFTYFRKHDMLLNMHQNAILEGIWIFQDFKYARSLHM